MHSDLLSSRGPPDERGTFLYHLWHRATTTTSLSENPQITVSLGLGSIMEIRQCATMKRARAKW